TSWLDRAGTDRITLERADEGVVLRVDSPDDESPRPHRLHIGVYSAGDDGLRRTALVPVETDGDRTVVDGVPDGDLLLVNDDDLTFASARPDLSSRKLMLTRAGELPTTMARAVVVGTAWDMLGNAEVTADEVVHCLVEVLRRETEAGVAEGLLSRAAVAAEQWSRSATREALLEEVADLAAELAGNPDLRAAALRVLAQTASTDAHVARVRAALDQAPEDTELGWKLLIRMAELGRLADKEVEQMLERDPDPDARVRALAVRAATPEPEAKEEVWRAVFEDRTVPSDQVFEIAQAFWRPGQEDLVRPYFARFLAMSTGLAGGNLLITVMVRAFFPGAVGDEAFLAEVQRVADDEGTSPTVRLNLLERADNLARMVRARRA
ncbi:MAG: ERAP1-like C-terminal domain-containing protein, partial [Nocardioidaceae bacterium]